jgi:acetolactate synthase I/III small subunit
MLTKSNQKQTIGILVENRPGVLARIVGLLSGRNFNIENITAAETHEPGITRITLVTTGDDQVMDQIVNQLRRLINVIKVTDFREKDFVDREMALIKVYAEQTNRAEILRIVDTFRAKIVDVSSHFYTLEVTGNEGKISAIIELLKGFGIVEIARTGKAALARNRLLEPERDEFLALEEKATLAVTKTALIKVSVDRQNRAEVLRIVDLFRGRIVDVGDDSCTVEVTGNEGAISGIIELLKDFGVSHIARPRRAAVAKSRKLEFQLGELLHFTGEAAPTRSKKH